MLYCFIFDNYAETYFDRLASWPGVHWTYDEGARLKVPPTEALQIGSWLNLSAAHVMNERTLSGLLNSRTA